MIEVLPDIAFKKELKKLSNASLSECMQCGNCSVVCSIAPENNPFPRKEMIWAGWGMKEKLLGNADIWLCHQCGDCSTHCPRNVKPADVLASIRLLSLQHYAKPAFLVKILNRPALLPVAVLIPVFFISLILFLAGTLHIQEGPVNYSKFFPHAWLNITFSAITLFSYIFAIRGLKRFWKDMNQQEENLKPNIGFVQSFTAAVKETLFHKKFNGCSSQKSRKISHLLVFYGFILLLLVTMYAIVAALTHNYPLSFTNPFKLLGNVAGLMLIAGLGLMIYQRIFNKKDVGNTNYADWLLLVSLMLLTLSGGMVELARFQNWVLAYHLYFFHLVCVWFTIIYLPYTKFGHLLYRFFAVTFAHSTGRWPD